MCTIRMSLAWMLAAAVIFGPATSLWAQEPATESEGQRKFEGAEEAPTEPAPQETAAEKPPPGEKKQEERSDDRPGGGLFGGGSQWLLIMLGGIVLLYLWMGRSRRKKEGQRREMLANLKKGDKVTSIGGIVGTIMEVREDEVTVKVDETSNVRMHFARWAVRGIGDQAKQQEPGQESRK